MKCMRCGNTVLGSPAFCTHCGAELPRPPKDKNAFYRISSAIIIGNLAQSILSLVIFYLFLEPFLNQADEFFVGVVTVLLLLGFVIPSYLFCACIAKSAQTSIWYGVYNILWFIIFAFVYPNIPFGALFISALVMCPIIFIQFLRDRDSMVMMAARQMQTARLDAFAQLFGYENFSTYIRYDANLQNQRFWMMSAERQMYELAHIYGWNTFDELELSAQNAASIVINENAQKLRTLLENKSQPAL